MSKKIFAIILALLMVVSIGVLASCGPQEEVKDDVIASPVPDKALESFTMPEDFKIGLICLHDEKSTYDLNFINSLKKAAAAAGLKEDQVLIRVNIEEGNACYEEACDLVDKGCKIIFADSFGHEDYMLKAAKEFFGQ